MYTQVRLCACELKITRCYHEVTCIKITRHIVDTKSYQSVENCINKKAYQIKFAPLFSLFFYTSIDTLNFYLITCIYSLRK